MEKIHTLIPRYLPTINPTYRLCMTLMPVVDLFFSLLLLTTETIP